MLDITSWVREKIFRRPSLITTVVWEEVSEKQTTKMGYFLLFCMFMAIISTAQWTLSIIRTIPEYPTSIPNCVDQMLSLFDANTTSQDGYSYYGSYYWYNECSLVSDNPEFDLSAEYKNLESPNKKLTEYNNTLTNLYSEKANIEYRQNNNRNDYNTALTEQIANEKDSIFNKDEIQADISTSRNELTNIENQITNLKSQIVSIQTQYAPQVSMLKNKRDVASAAYDRAVLVYRMIIALLSLLFSGLVFVVLYRMYVRRKINNSPHTIIFSVATFAYGIVLLQVLLTFLWEIIPHTFLNWLLGILSFFTPILYLIQFLWPIIIVWVFWYLVYKIQKRLYSKENLLKRFVTEKKCPNCGNAVDISKPFCPLCSHEIHVHCTQCGSLTMKGMPYCSNCWKTL